MSNTHTEELLGSPVFVKNVICVLPQLFHVRADKHLAKLDKVTVLFVVNFNHTPWVGTTPDFTAIRGLYNAIRANNSERNLAGNFLCLSNGFLIFVLVRGGLEDVNLVVGNVGKNL